jgi:hypothetical protein
MGRRLWRTVLCALVLGGATFGCHRSAVQNKQPPDPLLMTKKPVEGRLRGNEPGMTARAEMIPSPVPARDPAAAASPVQPVSPVQLGLGGRP